MSVHYDEDRGTWFFTRRMNGQQVRRRGFASDEAALRAEERLLIEFERNRRTLTPKRLTFEHYLTERWLPALRADPNRKPSTIAGYERIARAHLVPRLGAVKLGDVAGDHLTSLYGALRAEGKSERTVRFVHTTAHLALKDAVRWRLLPYNAAEDATAPAQTPPRPKAWTPEQVRTFLDAAERDRWWPLWRLAATTGMRRGEMAGLRWCDLDLDRGELVVAENRVVVDHQVFTGTPKGGRTRRLGLDPVTVDVLRAWKRQQAAERLVIGPYWPDTDLVFVWPDGSPVHPDVITRTYNRIRDAAELPKMHLHNLRHAFATTSLLGGVDIKVVSERLGHSSTRITHDIYTASVPALDRAAAVLVADLYDRPRGNSRGNTDA